MNPDLSACGHYASGLSSLSKPGVQGTGKQKALEAGDADVLRFQLRESCH